MATIKSGTYRFNDELTYPTQSISEKMQFVNTLTTEEGLGTPLIQFNIYAYTDGFNDSYDIIDISISYEDDYLMAISVYHSLEGGWGKDGYQTIYLTEEQEVSVEFAEWFKTNAKPVVEKTEDIDYLIKSSTLTSIADSIRTKTGKTDTLSPLQMPDEILSITSGGTDTSDATATAEHILQGYTAYGSEGKVEGVIDTYEGDMSEGGEIIGGSDANIVPLIVGDVGTYDANSPVIVTETFTGEGEPDAMFDYWGNQFPYFKAKKLVATRDIISLASDETLADKLYVDLFGDVTPIWQFEQNTNFTDTSFVIMSRGIPAILWVIATDERYFTQEAGFEDGGVYIADAWGLMGAAGNASVSALGIPDKPTDGFMPVTVSLPIEDELVVNIKDYINSGSTINDGILYRKVTIDGMTPKYLTITPTNQEQIFYPESDTFFSKITVEPIDISDLSKQKVLCGIYIDTLPKTEYKVGEWLEADSGTLVRLYTNGETSLTNLVGNWVYGFGEIARVPGTHKLTVKVTEGGITSQTVFWVTITE